MEESRGVVHGQTAAPGEGPVEQSRRIWTSNWKRDIAGDLTLKMKVQSIVAAPKAAGAKSCLKTALSAGAEARIYRLFLRDTLTSLPRTKLPRS